MERQFNAYGMPRQGKEWKGKAWQGIKGNEMQGMAWEMEGKAWK
jgi:hypothetical protein